MLRKCPSCLLEIKESDFLGKEECYKCIWEKKKLSSNKRGKNRRRPCQICGVEVVYPRISRCSEECTSIAIKNEWKNLKRANSLGFL